MSTIRSMWVIILSSMQRWLFVHILIVYLYCVTFNQAWRHRVWVGADRLVPFIRGVACWCGLSLYYLSYYSFYWFTPITCMVGVFLVPLCRDWMVQSDWVRRLIELKKHALLRYRSQFLADWQHYRVRGTTWILRFIVRKSSSSLLSSRSIPRSNFGKISVPLTVHSLPLLLYLCTCYCTFAPRNPSLLNSHFLDTLYFLRLIPLTILLTFFLPLLMFSKPSTLLQSFLSPPDLYNILKRIRLTSAEPLNLSGRILLLCFPQCLSIPFSIY